jgi:hypothetical protein
LSFEANQGQTDAQVRFLSRGAGYALFLTPTEAAFSLRKPAASATGSAVDRQASAADVLHTHLVGANAAPEVVGLDEQAGKSNYFLGNDPTQWRTNIVHYGKVAYRDVYRGIDLVYYGNQQQLEYDFVVQPGADPNVITLAFDGAQDLTLDAQGNLVIHMAGGDVMEHAPVIYQASPDGRQAIAGHYVLQRNHRVGFVVTVYDNSRPLIIDPVLAYATYLGGSDWDEGYGIAVDGAGNAYVTGETSSSNFPTAPGAFQGTYGGDTDAFVAKLNPSGTALVYSSYLGGSREDDGYGIAVDGTGNAYVTGSTGSTNFPTTSYFGAPGGGTFVTKFSPAGALVYSAILGSSNYSRIAVDGAGNAYVTGVTSGNFLTTPGAFQRTYGGGYSNAFVAKLNAGGSGLLYSTYLGGSATDYGRGIAVDGTGNAYVTGYTNSTNFPTTPGAFQRSSGGGFDAFVAKLNAGGSALAYSTYLGGSNYDFGSGIAVDGFGNAYVTGSTYSGNFPTTPGAFQRTPGGGGFLDAFVAKLNAGGSALVYSTYLGGSNDDEASAIAVDGTGNAYVTGHTYSRDFPTTPGAFQRSYGGGPWDAFVARLNAGGSALVYSTYLGGNDWDEGFGIAVDATGNAYVVGSTYSSNFPTTPGALQRNYGGGFRDAFVAKVPTCKGTTTHLSLDVPAEVSAGSPFTVTVSALDVYNNVDPFYRCTVHFASSDPTATLPTDYTFTEADAGRHTWTNGLTLRRLGAITITVAATADPSVSGVRIVPVVPGPARTLEITVPPIVTAGVSVDLTVTARDQFGNPATGYRGTVCFTSSDARATLPVCYTFTLADLSSHTWRNGLTMHTAGRQTVTVTDTVNPSLADTTALLVVPGLANGFILAEIPPVFTAGVPSDVRAVAVDRDGNVAPSYRGTVHFISSDGAATLPDDYQFGVFDNGQHIWYGGIILRTAGSQTVTITDVDNSSLTGSVNVTVTPAPALSFFADAPSSVTSGIPFDVNVSALDPYGNVDSNYAGTVTFTSSDTDPGVVLPADYTFNGADAGAHTFSGETTLVTGGDQNLTVADPAGRLVGSATITVNSGPATPGGRGSGSVSVGLLAEVAPIFNAATIPGSFQDAPPGGGHGASPTQVAPTDPPASTGGMPSPLAVERLNRLFAAVGRQSEPARFFSPRDGFVLDSDFLGDMVGPPCTTADVTLVV